MGDDINRFFPKLEQGLSFSLLSAGMQWETPSGIKGGGLFTNYYRSSRFTNRVRNPKDEMCAPDAVVLCNDINQGMYCHLVCALAQSTSIVRLYTLFSGKSTFIFALFNRVLYKTFITDCWTLHPVLSVTLAWQLSP